MHTGGPFDKGRFSDGRFSAGRFSAKFGQGGPVVGGVQFGALTRAGAGGVAAPSGATAISGGSAVGYTVSGGLVVPVANGSADSGTLEFAGSGQVWTVSTVPNTYSVLADQSQIEAAASAAGLASTRTILVRDGVATGARVRIARRFTGRLTIRSVGWGATLPGVDLSGSDNITLDGLTLERFWNGEPLSQTTLVVHVPDTNGITVTNCIISSDPLAGLDLYSSAGVRCLTLIGTPAATPANTLTVTDCILRECLKPLRLTASDGCVFERNTMSNCYGSFGELQGSNWRYKDNRGSGIWAHGGGLGQTGPNNPTGSAALYPYDWGDPHSSLFGTGSSGDNQVFMGNVLVVGPERQLAKGDYPGIASGPKWNDPIPAQTITYSNVVCKYNVLGVADNTGIVVGYMRDSVVSHNTVFYDTDYGTNPKPNIYFSELGENVVISHNVTCTYIHGTAGTVLGVDPGTYVASHENIVAMAAGQQGTQPGDAMEYSSLFAGPIFSGVTAINALARFTPLPGGRLMSGALPIGAVGPFYNHATGVETPPVWSKPVTATATGMPTARVVFGAGDFTRLSDASGPIMDLSNTDELTILMALRFDAAQDGQDVNITMAAGYTMVVRRLPAGYLRVYLEAEDGTGAVSFDTSLRGTSADGLTLWAISMRLSTYDLRVMKGAVIDPLVTVALWRGVPHAVNRTTFDVMSNAAGTVEFFWMTDEFVDLHDQEVLDRVVAQDGLRPSYFTDGSAVTGTVPKVYLTGNAAAWNAPTGLNRGSVAERFVMTGAVTDAIPMTAPSALSLGDWQATTSLTPFGIDVTILAAPIDNGAPITGYEYSTDSGLTWTALELNAAGVVAVTETSDGAGFAELTAQNLQVRAVNSVGAGAGSDVKTATSASSESPELVPDPGFDLPGHWDYSAQWSIAGGTASINHTTGIQRVLYSDVGMLTQVEPNTAYDFSLDVVSLTTHTGRFRVFVYPAVGSSFQSPQLVYDTNTMPRLAEGATITGTFTTGAGINNVRLWLESTSATLVGEFDNVSIKKI